jgi:deazaflavin-dependent oxidoreductase (nitroreductase family)
MQRLAQRIARLPWLSRIGPRLVFLDAAVQRWTGGRLAVARLGGMTTVLLTTTGRRTGLPRDTPLIAIPEGGSLLLVGSNWGKPGHPAWSTNLLANPNATIRTRGHTFPVTATLLTGDERAEAWPLLIRTWPVYDDYTARSNRELRVFRVTLR